MGVDWSTVLTWTFWLVVIASFPSVIWFYKFRRTMIKRQIAIINTLERTFKPKDKRYTVHGYLVGFTGKYWINRGNIIKAWAYYVTPPYHVFFYLPVIQAFKKKERMDITVELKSIRYRGEAHIAVPRDGYVSRTLGIDMAKKKPQPKETKIMINSKSFRAYYTSNETLDAVVEVFKVLNSLQDVRRISIDSSKKGVHVSIVPKLEALQEFLDKLISIADSAR
ncbi:MAG: hypothetical protein F7B60_01505 [Desulfurococcales archaeon]|nr:hypothetical protein [Desulfurococcales archaeon]